ncbi:mitochondrial carrier domain-containing protein [Apodospora peruviana]|uniref:Mitochondrial carrier domain-containing protein n=1 Tax=Apodospora peruviana TaxID=516989 RepID=A0AAE0M3N9_9PEZI|nr:mitochondrial carrier domain-containing protein [Apodospora peruviana]
MSGNTNVEVLMAGAVAAFTVDLLVYPLDTIKTRYQSQDYRSAFAQPASPSASPKPPPPKQLFRGLYQGIGSVIFATLPAAGIFFLTYESAKSAIASGLPSATPQPVIHSLASGSAEMASCVVLAPAEVIKQNAQMLRRSGSNSNQRSTSIQALRMVWRSTTGTSRSLWAGYTALVARNLPFTAMHFPMFEFLRGHIWDWRGRHHAATGDMSRTALVTGASAAVSGALAAIITTPADVVKTRIMLSAGDSPAPPGSGSGPVDKREKSGLDVAKTIFREKGLRGLFRGALLRASWTALGSGLYLGSYEAAKFSLKGAKRTARSDDHP